MPRPLSLQVAGSNHQDKSWNDKKVDNLKKNKRKVKIATGECKAFVHGTFIFQHTSTVMWNPTKNRVSSVRWCISLKLKRMRKR